MGRREGGRKEGREGENLLVLLRVGGGGFDSNSCLKSNPIEPSRDIRTPFPENTQVGLYHCMSPGCSSCLDNMAALYNT